MADRSLTFDIFARDRASAAFQSVAKSSDSLSKKVTRDFDTLGGKITGAMGKAFKVGAAAAVAAAGATIALGVKRLVGIEEAQAKMRGLGYDAKTVEQVMTNALASVRGTAFGLADAAAVAAGVLAAGVKPGADLERTLKLVGDAATIAGSSFGEMGSIFNKVGAANRLTMSEVNQLSDRGIPIMQWLADQYGVTAVEARKMVEKGKVDFEGFREAIETNIAGAALESGNTTMGALKNVGAAAGRLGAVLVGPVFKQAQGFFTGLIDWIDGLTTKVEPFAKAFGEQLAGAIQRVAGAAQGLFDLFIHGDFTGKLREAFGWEEDSPMVAAILRIRDAVMDAATWIDNNRDAIARLAAAVGPAIAIVAGMAVAVHGVSAAFRIAAAATPVGAVLLLVSALVYAWQNSETFRTVVTDVFNKVSAVVGPIIAAVVGWVQGLGKSTSDTGTWLGDTWTKIRGIFKSALDAVTAIVKFATDIIRDLWNRFGTHILTFISGTWDRIKQVIDGVLKVISGIFEVFAGAFTGDWSRVWDGIKSILAGVWDVIKALIAHAFETIKTVIGGAMAVISAVWSAAWDRVKQAFADVWQGIKDKMSESKEELLSAVRGLKDSIVEFFSGAKDWLVDAGKNIIQGLIDGIGKMVGAVGRKMNEIVSSVTDRLPWSPAKAGPLRSHPPEEGGRNIVSAMAAGMGAGLPTLAAAADAAARAALPDVGTVTVPRGTAVGGFSPDATASPTDESHPAGWMDPKEWGAIAAHEYARVLQQDGRSF